MPRPGRQLSVWLAALALVVGAGLAVVGLRPVLASASPATAVEPAVAVLPRAAPAPAVPAIAHVRAAADVPETRPSGDAGTEAARSLTARIQSASVAVYRKPGGDRLATLGPTTEFGSPRTFSVVARRGRWLGVVAPELGNGTVGWVDGSAQGVAIETTAWSVTIDLSDRIAVVEQGGEVVRRFTIGVGGPGSPTPTGRFAVTDKLPGDRYSPAYGCCIIALSARQPNLPPGWTGGDRIAIHGTNDPSSIGAASSAGCPHAGARDLRFLMEHLPLGTPVVIAA